MLEVSLDWLEFTFHAFRDYRDIIDLLNYHPSEFVECHHALYGYHSMLKHEEYHIYLLFDGTPEMGIHLKVAGHSIDHLLQNLGIDCYEFIESISGFGDFTRIDIALDDIEEEFFSVKDILKYMNRDQYSMRFKNWSTIRLYDANENKLNGDTIYLGRRSSDTFFRIYDKQLETKFKTDKDIPPTCRWELEAKHESADKLSDLIIKEKNLGIVFFQVLTNSFRLIKKDDLRKSRCSTLKRYDEFTQYMDQASIGKSKKILSVDQKMKWLMESCSKSLALASCRDPDFSDKMIQNGFDQFTDNDKNTVFYEG